jgi:hypothetical protein
MSIFSVSKVVVNLVFISQVNLSIVIIIIVDMNNIIISIVVVPLLIKEPAHMVVRLGRLKADKQLTSNI